MSLTSLKANMSKTSPLAAFLDLCHLWLRPGLIVHPVTEIWESVGFFLF